MIDRNEPLELMDEIERSGGTPGMHGYVTVDPNEWQSLRTALETQRDELAQKDARIARLEDAIVGAGIKDIDEWRNRLTQALNEHPHQSAAALKAEALREAADEITAPTTTIKGSDAQDWIRRRADRIEREAKEQDDE